MTRTDFSSAALAHLSSVPAVLRVLEILVSELLALEETVHGGTAEGSVVLEVMHAAAVRALLLSAETMHDVGEVLALA